MRATLGEVCARCEAREVELELAELRGRWGANGLVALVLAGLRCIKNLRDAEPGPPYSALDAEEEVLVAKAESRGIALVTTEKFEDVQSEVVPMRSEDEISTQPV